MSRPREERAAPWRRHWDVAGTAALLGVSAVAGALVIGVVTHRYTVNATQAQYRGAYLKTARLLAAVGDAEALSNQDVLRRIESQWLASGQKPADEYLCVVDQEARLLLHTADPEAVGTAIGEESLLGDEEQPRVPLRTLIASARDYVGGYIASSGQPQVAALTPVPRRGWTLGIHRARAALDDEVRSGMRFLSGGFVAVCCVLMPASLLVMYSTCRRLSHRQRHAEEELEKRRVFQEAVLDCVADGIVACEKDGTLAYFNPATREFHGLPSEPIPPDQWADHYGLYEGDGKTPLKKEHIPLFRALEGEEVVDQEMVIAPQNLPQRTLLATGRMLTDSRGNSLGAVVSMHDVTKRKRAEKALQRAHDELEQRVAERTAELAAANASLRTQVAERERAEDALRREREFSEQVIDSSVDGILAFDREYRYTAWNPQMEIISGVKRAEVLGKNVFEVFPVLKQTGEAEFFREALAGKTVVSRERPYRIPESGQEGYFEGYYSPLRTESGEIIGGISIIRDITEHKRAEDAFREQAATLNSIFRVAPIGIGLISDRIIKRVNTHLCDLLGYSSEDLVDQSARMLYASDEEFEWVGSEKYAQIRNRGTGTVDTHWQRKDGTIIDVLLSSTPVDPGDLSAGVTFTALDITERKKAEQKLRESEERFRSTFEQAAVGIAHVAPTGEFQRVNRRFCQIVGYSREEMLARTFQDITHADDLDEDLEQVCKLLAGRIGSYSMEKRYIHRSGSVVWVQLTVSLMREPSGEPKYLIAVIEDISERKRTEEALLESERQFRLLLETSPIAMIISDLAHRFQYLNGKFVELFGYTLNDIPTAEEWWQLAYPKEEYRQEIRSELYRRVEGAIEHRGEIQPLESVVRCRDGSTRAIEVRLASIGERSIIVMNDLTERKRAEEALRESEQKFRNIVQSSPMGIHMYTLEPSERLVLTGSNPAADRILGVDCRQFLGQTIEQAFPLLAHSEVPHHYRRACSHGEPWHTEKVDYDDARIEGAYEFHAFQTAPGTMAVMFLDITERKQAEAAVRDSEARLQTIMDNSPALISIKDLKGNLTMVNRRFEVLAGPSPEELVGRNIYDLFPQQVADALWQTDLAALKAGGPVEAEEVVNHKDGVAHTYLTVKFPLIGESREPFGICAISTDITERKRAEEELRQFAETQSVLAREVNHRVKNNLSAIISMLHKEEDRARSEGTPDYLPPLRSLAGRVEGLATVHSLLSATGWRPLVFSRLCEQVIRAALHGLPLSATIELKVADSPVRVTSNQAHHLTLVVNELATNSAKHALGDRESACIEVRTSVAGDMVRVWFRDDGPGYPEQILSGDFSQAGIGFDLVRGIVSQTLRGTVELANEGGAVTCFTFMPEIPPIGAEG